MNERVTIGGTSYEAVGSKSSNLLLRCNGTARIEWGDKLIDLIKNGKIAVENNSPQLQLISSENEIRKDGIYVIPGEDIAKLIIRIKGTNYTFNKE